MTANTINYEIDDDGVETGAVKSISASEDFVASYSTKSEDIL